MVVKEGWWNVGGLGDEHMFASLPRTTVLCICPVGAKYDMRRRIRVLKWRGSADVGERRLHKPGVAWKET